MVKFGFTIGMVSYLTGGRYLHFSQNVFEDLLDNLNLTSTASMDYFQHDCVPPQN